MALTYIAFIECVFDSVESTKWHTKSGFPFDDPRTVREIKRAIGDDAKMSLVDIKNDRRYFRFKQKAEVQIVNNVVVFDSDWAEELAIDEDVQFPKTKKMTDCEERMADVKKCEYCGHTMSEHFRDFNGNVNCQICERKGRTCD